MLIWIIPLGQEQYQSTHTQIETSLIQEIHCSYGVYFVDARSLEMHLDQLLWSNWLRIYTCSFASMELVGKAGSHNMFPPCAALRWW